MTFKQLCCALAALVLVSASGCAPRQPATPSSSSETAASQSQESSQPTPALLDELAQSVTYVKETGELSFVFPNVPADRSLRLVVNGRILGDDGYFITWYAFEEETADNSWVGGKTYTTHTDPTRIEDISIFSMLSLPGSAEFDDQRIISIDKDGHIDISTPPTPEEAAEDYYENLLASKHLLIPKVRDIVELYRRGLTQEEQQFSPVYPKDYPPASTLPDVTDDKDFAIRYTGNPDAKGSIYLAVPIDVQHELHLFPFSYLETDGKEYWGCEIGGFAKVSELSWQLQDIDLYPTA